MPYDKNGKYYRQPVYNKKFILKNDHEEQVNNKEKADEVEFKKRTIAKNKSLLRYIWLFLILYLSGVFFFIYLPNSGPKSPSNNLPSSKKNESSVKNEIPSIEETLDNMFQYQKERDSNRLQEQIILEQMKQNQQLNNDLIKGVLGF
tara:strand:+ start:114 stop:554 length:441 start_codon:yes stop_codon:yes gene_type:complete